MYDNNIHKFNNNDIILDGDTFLVNYYDTYYDILQKNPLETNVNGTLFSTPLSFPS
jgi:hypothetical protein